MKSSILQPRPELQEVSTEPRWRERLQRLYLAEGRGVARMAFVLTRSHDAAADITQEAFARIATRVWSLSNDEHLRAYLYRTAINLCHGRARRIERHRRVDEELRRIPGPHVGRAGDDQDVWAALKNVPVRQRAALYLRYYLDLSESETAAMLGCSLSATKSLVNRGLRHLRSELGGERA